MRGTILVMCVALAGCGANTSQTPVTTGPAVQTPRTMVPAQATQSFAQVVNAVEPVAERVCREQTRGVNCDFRIVVDNTPEAASNAYQSLDKNGRPVITFTQALFPSKRPVWIRFGAPVPNWASLGVKPYARVL